MNVNANMSKLKELAGFEADGDYDGTLSRLMDLVSELLSAGRVSLMLLDSVGDRGQQLKLVALHGDLPKAAWDERAPLGKGIAAKVLAEQRALVVGDINATHLKDVRRHPGESASFIACPVPIAGEPAGVLNVSDGQQDMPFTEQDLAQAELAAILVGRAIQILRLRGLLDSSFAKMALTLEGVTDSQSFMNLSVQEPQRVAKILAKAFYREMSRCGFTANQIIHAAGEILSELTDSMNRHKQRRKRMEH